MVKHILAIKKPCYSATFCLLLMIAAFMLAASSAQAQSREQCHKCCESKGFDEYYLDQCKVKCFRAPEHCVQDRPAPIQQPAANPEPAVRPTPPPPQQPQRVAQPPRQPAPAPQFRFPPSLDLVPGKEWEAAGQILAANNISPQHPAYQTALNNIVTILVNFVRANPAGGKLPTAELERVVRQFR